MPLASGFSWIAFSTCLASTVSPASDFDLDDGELVGLRDLGPALAEFTGVQGDDFVAAIEKVRDGGIHRARSGRGQKQDVLLGLVEIFQTLANVLKDSFKCGCAMVNDRFGKDRGNGLRDRRRAGRQEIGFFHRVCISFFGLKRKKAAVFVKKISGLQGIRGLRNESQ